MSWDALFAEYALCCYLLSDEVLWEVVAVGCFDSEFDVGVGVGVGYEASLSAVSAGVSDGAFDGEGVADVVWGDGEERVDGYGLLCCGVL